MPSAVDRQVVLEQGRCAIEIAAQLGTSRCATNATDGSTDNAISWGSKGAPITRAPIPAPS
jgi:hypothetical protein